MVAVPHGNGIFAIGNFDSRDVGFSTITVHIRALLSHWGPPGVAFD